jgi:rifampicin phosphotransferase
VDLAKTVVAEHRTHPRTTVAMLRRIRAGHKRMPQFLAGAPGRCERLRAEIEQTTDATVLASLWPAKVRPLVEEACDMLSAAVAAHGTTLLSVPGKLATLAGEADSALLLSGQQAGGTPLASLGPVTGLARLGRGEIDRDTFARQYGHRGSHEMELSIPRPAEDPAWIDGQLAALHDTAHDADALLADQEAARAAAWERLAGQDPKKAAAARKLIARWAPVARDREAARSEVARSAWVARTWVRRAGQLTGHGDDLFFLELPETVGLLRGDPAPLAKMPARRASYEIYRNDQRTRRTATREKHQPPRQAPPDTAEVSGSADAAVPVSASSVRRPRPRGCHGVPVQVTGPARGVAAQPSQEPGNPDQRYRARAGS